MARKHVPPPAGGTQATQQRYNPYDTNPYDPLEDPPSVGKTPLNRDDASNENLQPRPQEPPSPPR